MSVYKPAKSRFWHYDFQYQARRFFGSTGVETRRKAEAVERKKREDAALGRVDRPAGPAGYTLDEAAGRWWSEHGQHRGDAGDAERRLERLLKLFPPAITLAELDTACVSLAIERRRGLMVKRGPKGSAKLPTNAVVNRDVIACLRPILRRAASHWTPDGAPALPVIDWRSLRLGEPRELVRVYSAAEISAWRAKCADPERLAFDLLLTYGLRFGELFFDPAAFEPDGPRLAWSKGRKGDVPHTVPLLARHAAAIAARAGRAQAVGLPHIWYVEELDPTVRRAGPASTILRPLTYWELEGRLTRAADRAGVPPGRRIHGLRHHAGTAILRSTGSLKAAQRLLGHASIASTQRYAHVLEDDLRQALETADTANKPASSAEEKTA
jgi:integrase